MTTPETIKKVSVVIPVYNEQDSLPELLRRTTEACQKLNRDYEFFSLMMAAATTLPPC
ncbi:Undecaprenyl-phosphate 4-deoxy-4-formamido-L-arabinose transferase [Cedecea neteri]|uniref:Undecaprenyl-phosphate 4-deoxy-4-formamido-L-arabinose transferase n=1 Tax=Cedecea neteri TaxID=158822 RepID=A0A2X3JE43_9ENTR|nr:Undecaprenyl-phosphate 4-deoxy-4-formamido-L-arabinose transferase [Cedecea neteri]